MNEDKTNWRINRLEENDARNDERLDELERFKESTVEKLKTVYKRLKDLENTNQWVSRSIFYLILSGVVGAFFTLVVWLITG